MERGVLNVIVYGARWKHGNIYINTATYKIIDKND